MRRVFCVWMVVFSWLGSCCLASDRPNLVLIMADDFGFECVTANGGESYETPHLDRMAAEGVRFENCHVQPLCTPTRVQLMTGIYNVRNYTRFGELDPKATTFGNLLRDAGYATGICGKWQLGHEVGLPRHFGFQESCLWQHTRRPPRYANPGLEYNGEPRDFNDGEYGPQLVNDWALEFIERHKEGPFFLYYPMILTHDPFQPTPDSDEWDPTAVGEKVNRDTANFAHMTRFMDKMVGRVLDKLDALGIGENTLVVFLGDNGTQVTVHSRFKGADYVGGKGTRTARGTHVPLIVRWPAGAVKGAECADLVNSTDFLPTLCEAAGVKVPDGLQIDGRSFLPQVLGKSGRPREWGYCWYSRGGGGEPQFEYAMTLNHKLYRDGRFFDLNQDPFEEQPLPIDALASDQAAEARLLGGVLEQFAEARPEHLRVQFPAVKIPGTPQAQPAKKKNKKSASQE